MVRRIPPQHPGLFLKSDYMDSDGITFSALAKALRVDVMRIRSICKGERSISLDTSMRLGKFFGQNPRFWFDLYAQYEFELAKENKLDVRIDREVVSRKELIALESRQSKKKSA
jgi:antitoxin HigA-1